MGSSEGGCLAAELATGVQRWKRQMGRPRGLATELADVFPEARPEGKGTPGKCPFQLFTSQLLFITSISAHTFDLWQRGDKIK